LFELNDRWDNFVKFKGTLEKQRTHWDDFVKFKESEKFKERSRKNKENAEKKKWHHRLGPSGYQVTLPKWDKAEQEMVAAGVPPCTLSWPDRCKRFFYAHRGKLDPATGDVLERASLKDASEDVLDAINDAIEEARTGAFMPN
jgi:hypothetical protein